MTNRSSLQVAVATLLLMLPLARFVIANAAEATAAPDAATAPAGAAAPAATAAAPATSAGATGTKKDELQEVVVYGMTANLEKSLDIKRTAPVVLDSINSVELGRFPDADVADSLAHLPGVTLERTTGGEGIRISIRGLSAGYNIVTLENR
ncbi:MAG TPA: TonB-dependent receptor plug domain-containing protein, partial [Steroidobacteraceae bacterium]